MTATDLEPTTMMEQYKKAKERHPDMLLLFRMGDFYEAFNEDARIVADVLNLTITHRDKDMPMAGFPRHAIERHLGALLRDGHRVAVCDQEEVNEAFEPEDEEVEVEIEIPVEDKEPVKTKRKKKEASFRKKMDTPMVPVVPPTPIELPLTLAHEVMANWPTWTPTQWRRLGKDLGGPVQKACNKLATRVTELCEPISFLNAHFGDHKIDWRGVAHKQRYYSSPKIVFQLTEQEVEQATLFWSTLDGSKPDLKFLLKKNKKHMPIKPTAVAVSPDEMVIIRFQGTDKEGKLMTAWLDGAFIMTIWLRNPEVEWKLESPNKAIAAQLGGKTIAVTMPLTNSDKSPLVPRLWLWI